MICDHPFLVNRDYGQPVPVPCGRCPPCKTRRVNSWVFRLMEEEKRSSTAFFVTLTYDTAHVPISEKGYMTLKKSDFQDYMKRLRKLCSGCTLKYYAVGEYGSENLRPHFHAIIFNVPRETLFADAWSLNGVQFGTVHVGSLTTDSCAYTMKYIDKAQRFSTHGRVPEFALMSKGLGSNYITNDTKRYHSADVTRLYCTKLGGYKIAMPKYYRDKIYSDAQRALQTEIIGDIIYQEEQYDRSMYRGDNYEADQHKQKEARSIKFYSRIKKRNL